MFIFCVTSSWLNTRDTNGGCTRSNSERDRYTTDERSIKHGIDKFINQQHCFDFCNCFQLQTTYSESNVRLVVYFLFVEKNSAIVKSF